MGGKTVSSGLTQTYSCIVIAAGLDSTNRSEDID